MKDPPWAAIWSSGIRFDPQSVVHGNPELLLAAVDWRNGVARDAERILKPLGYQIDWLAFADAWRALYQPSMEEVRSGRQPFVKFLHRRMLHEIKPKFGLEKLDNKAADDLNLAWHRLDTWPDTVPGFVRLKRKLLSSAIHKVGDGSVT